MQRITEVLIQMDGIVSECKLKEFCIRHFAVLHRQVTSRI